MDTTVLARYIEIKQMIEMLSVELDELKPQVDDLMGNADKLSYQGYKFVRAYRKKWQYTDRVAQAEAALKAQKQTEESTGLASYTTTAYLMLRSQQNQPEF